MPRAGGRWLAVAVWLAAMAVCAVIALRATFTADMSAFLPRAPTPEQRLLVGQLSDGLVSRLVLVGIAGADAPTHAALSRRLAARLRTDTRFVAVANGEAASLERDQAVLFRHRYALSPAVDAQRFTVEGLRAAVQDTLDLLASPAGLLVKDVLARDPTGEIAVLVEALGALAASGERRPNTVDGVWASRDGGRAVLLVQTRAPGGDTDAQQGAVRAVQAAFGEARRDVGDAGAAATLQLAGPGVFGVQVREQIEREVTRLSLAGAALIIVLLLVLYRSLTALVLGLLPVASGVLVAVAAVSLGFGTVHGLTLGFGTTLIGEAVDYSIYLFVQSRQGGAARADGEAAWVRHFWPTVRLGVLTSICGFAALLFSGFPGLAQLGLYSIAGLVTAAAVTRYVLPRLLPAGFTVRDISAPGRWLAGAAARAGVARWPALALIAGAAAVVGWHGERAWAGELASLSPVSAQDQALDQGLRADLGAPDVRFLVVISGATQEAALQAAERATAALQPLLAANLIGGVDSPSQLLPSMVTQQQRLAAIPPPEVLRTRLGEALQPLPLRPERVPGFLQDAERARQDKPVQRADLEGTSLAVGLDGLLVPRAATVDGPAGWSAFLPLHAPRAAPGTPAAEIDPVGIRAALPPPATGDDTRTLFVDLKGEADALYRGYLHEAALLSLGGLAAIVVLVGVALRSVSRLLRVMAPLAGAVLLVMAALALAGQRLNLLHGVGLLLVVAVGSNYALFFAGGAAKPGEGISPTTLASLLFANIAAVAGFGVLAASSVPVLQAIGITVGPGAVLALLLSAVFAAPRAPGAAA